MANGQRGGGSAQLETGSIVNGAGGDADILKGISAGVATLRSLLAGANVTLTENADTIEIAASGGGGGSLAAPLSDSNGVQIDLTATPSALASVSLPAPAGSSDDYLISYTVSEYFGGVTTTGAAHSVYALSTGGAPFGLTTGAYLGTTSGLVDAPLGGNISGTFALNITGAATLNLLGAVSSFANISAGAFELYAGFVTLTAQRVRENA